MKIKIILLLSIFAISTACKTVDPCPDEAIPGNLGSVFNSDYDEYSPFFFEGAMYFTTTRLQSFEPEAVFKSEMVDGKFSAAQPASELPLSNYKNSGLPVFYRNPESQVVEMYFAGVSPKSKTMNRDLFYAEFSGGVWNEPTPIADLNTASYESHPAISPDGRLLVFASDRQPSVGDIDLWVSARQPDGTWSEPINLIKINTEGNELSPYIAEDYSLYFASRGYEGFGGYDIIKADWNELDGWQNPRVMPFPINTESNESGPALLGGKLFIDSDRRGGCGGKDLYEFELCGPVFLDFEVSSESGNTSTEGIFHILDENDSLIYDFPVVSNTIKNIRLEANTIYKLQYFNSCLPYYVPEQVIMTPCSDTSSVRLVQKFTISDFMRQFDFEQYKVPFFVSGYYRLNTLADLESLRMKFQYNLLGVNDSTAYIEKPDEKYNDFAFQVEKALNESANYIVRITENLNPECFDVSKSTLNIKITGYADPRAFSPKAHYLEDDIIDPNFNLSVSKGSKMTNELLSKLRAYYTAKHLQNVLSRHDSFNKYMGNVRWEIIGKGVDTNPAIEDIYKRRVNIEIGVVK